MFHVKHFARTSGRIQTFQDFIGVTNSTSPDATPVIDYEGSGYRTDFWEGQGREYEDAVERVALGQLLPPTGKRIAEIGAGFGRLAQLYAGYDQVILFDYSRSLLQEAAERWGDDPRFVFVAGNIYELPLADAVLDTLVMVRVMHHLADVPQALGQLRRVLHGQGVAVLEYANKRNLKAIARWLLGRQSWSPFAPEPVEFVRLNYDFHPGWMGKRMVDAGLDVTQQYAVSHFRVPALKQRVSPDRLAAAEQPLFGIGGRFPLAPSVFVQARSRGDGQNRVPSVAAKDIPHLLRCPHCNTSPLRWEGENEVVCPSCNRCYAKQGQVWDMKDARLPLE